MLKIIFFILFFLFGIGHYAQGQCYPGEMPDKIIYACEGDTVKSLAFNSEVFSGCVLAYTLHDFGGGFLSNPLEINLSGSFTMGDAYLDEIYYICAVAGLDEDNDGYPDLDHPETQTSFGTEVQFKKNNPFELVYDCNENDGSINIALNLPEEGINPLRTPFVLSHDFALDTLIVNNTPITLPYNTRNLDLQLIEPPIDYCYTIENIEQLQQACFFDLALRLTERDNKAESYAPEDTVTLKVELFNQGSLPVKSTELVAYLPQGFYTVSANWFFNEEDNQATHFVEDILLPDSSKSIIIELLLSEDLEAEIYTPTVEIASFQSLDGTFLNDIDSEPDRNKQNDLIFDDEILDNVVDEDDHDISELQIILNTVNKYPELNDKIWINTIKPVPVSTMLTIHYKSKDIQPVQIDLYNTNGQKLETYTQMPSGNLNTMLINMTNLADGIYFVRLSNQHQIVSRRVVKQ